MIGFDLLEVDKIEDEDKLLKRIAQDCEIEYIQKFQRDKKQRVASLWAVKEAVFKALQADKGEFSFKEIVLHHKDNGAPYVELLKNAKKCFDKRGAKQIFVSISHQKNVVGAVVEIL